MLILAIDFDMKSEMSDPEKPTTMAKTKSVPRLRLLPVMVPKLMPNTICTIVRMIESMMKTAKLARIRRPIRLSMA